MKRATLCLLALAACQSSPAAPAPETLAGSWGAETERRLCGHMDCVVLIDRYTLEVDATETRAVLTVMRDPVLPRTCEATLARTQDAVTLDGGDCGTLDGTQDHGGLHMAGTASKHASLTFRRQ